MSAFEVDNTHIDVMVSAALVKRGSDGLTWYHETPASEIPHTEPGEALPGRHEEYLAALKRNRREVTRENAEQWGATLLAENRRSVNHRYNEDEIEAPYTFTEYTGRINPVAILSALACYRYQSCEHPGWKGSEAYDFCEALQEHMIRLLPGYDSAPWEITDPAQGFHGQPQKVWRGSASDYPAHGAGQVVNLSDLIAKPAPVRAAALFESDDREFADCDAATLIQQIGPRNVLAISGGRYRRRTTGVTLPVSNGYSVTIDLAGDDTYTVRRVFKRGDRTWVKGERRGVHCDEVGEAAYQASCFRNMRFPETAA